MKRIIIAFVILMMMAPMALFSQNNAMTAHFKNGQVVDFLFTLEPVVTFEETANGTEVVLTYKGFKFNYPLANLTKFTFSKKDLPTEVEEIVEDVRNVTYFIDGYTINITGAKAETPLRIYASDGKIMEAYKTDKEGALSFSIEDLPDGMYVINSDEITFKIQKK
jgi:hypothetical protein